MKSSTKALVAKAASNQDKPPKKNVVLPPTEVAERPVPAIVRDMKPALRSVYDHILDKLNSTERRNATTLYGIGVQVQHVMSDEGKHGHGAVESLAKALGQKLTPATLRTYARVTTMFSQDEVTAILDKPTTNNRRLGFSHLIALSSVSDKMLRAKLLRKTYAESWSFVELQMAVREALGRGGSDRPIVPPATPKAGLSQLATAVSALVARNEVWETTIFTPLDGMETLSPQLRKLVEDTESKLETALQRIEATRERLHSLLETPVADEADGDEDPDELKQATEAEEDAAAAAGEEDVDDTPASRPERRRRRRKKVRA